MLASWKTSLTGLATSALYVATNGHTWKQCLVAFGVALMGVLAKDEGTAPKP